MIRSAASTLLAGSLLLALPALPAVPAVTVVPEPVTVIRNNGPAENRVNLVILGDGYTEEELSRYAQDVDVLVADLFRQPPYSLYASYFNVTRVDVVSPVSGVSHPELGVIVPSALGATYNCAGIQRLICANHSRVNEVLARSVPVHARDMVLVLVNDPEYGGSGGAIAVISSHPAAVELALHEFGHSFGLLADEYTSQPPTCVNTIEPPEVNATRVRERAAIKWAGWIDPATPVPTAGQQAGVPGLYEGAKYCPSELFRPTFDSKMRTFGRPFEQINTEQLILRMYNFVAPIDMALPLERTLTKSCGERADFLVEPVRPSTSDLQVRWRVDGVVRGTAASFSLNTSILTLGEHTVDVEVFDPTPAVRRDPAQLLRQELRWTVTVTPSASPAIFGFAERGCVGTPPAPGPVR